MMKLKPIGHGRWNKGIQKGYLRGQRIKVVAPSVGVVRKLLEEWNAPCVRKVRSAGMGVVEVVLSSTTRKYPGLGWIRRLYKYYPPYRAWKKDWWEF